MKDGHIASRAHICQQTKPSLVHHTPEACKVLASAVVHCDHKPCVSSLLRSSEPPQRAQDILMLGMTHAIALRDMVTPYIDSLPACLVLSLGRGLPRTGHSAALIR